MQPRTPSRGSDEASPRSTSRLKDLAGSLERSADKTQQHAKTRGPWSIVTAACYLVPAYILLPDHPVAAFAFAVLAIGTFLFHATDNDYQLDGAGMLASTCALVGLPISWLVEALAVAFGFAIRGFYSHLLLGLLIVPVAVVALIDGAWAWLLGALVLLGIGFWIWQRDGDVPHAIWHVATAAGMTLLVIGL